MMDRRDVHLSNDQGRCVGEDHGHCTSLIKSLCVCVCVHEVEIRDEGVEVQV